MNATDCINHNRLLKTKSIIVIIQGDFIFSLVDYRNRLNCQKSSEYLQEIFLEEYKQNTNYVCEGIFNPLPTDDHFQLSLWSDKNTPHDYLLFGAYSGITKDFISSTGMILPPLDKHLSKKGLQKACYKLEKFLSNCSYIQNHLLQGNQDVIDSISPILPSLLLD